MHGGRRRGGKPGIGRVAAALGALLLPLGSSLAQEPAGDIRDLRIGLVAAEMPPTVFDPACGTNGGPPSEPLDGFEDFMQCRPEANGLREVYLVFDDELAQFARANPELDLDWVHKFSGTVIAGFPVILSVLFDEGGTVRGIRAVTDPRAGVDKRSDAYLFRIPVQRRFGADGWECADIPRAEGESEMGGIFLKQRCVKRFPDRTMLLESRFYRKPGQRGVDAQGQYVPGDYESSTRLEILDPSVPLPPLPPR